MMMAYGLGRNVALLLPSLYSFNQPPPPTSKPIKQENLATYYNLISIKAFDKCKSIHMAIKQYMRLCDFTTITKSEISFHVCTIDLEYS